MTNYETLVKVCNHKEVIIPVSEHRKPDGSMDIERNLTTWNKAVEQFETIKLWDKETPEFDDRDPLQIEPNIIFIPSIKGQLSGTIIVACGGGFETRTGCEGFHVAKYFVEAGFNCAILTYRLKPYGRKHAMMDMQRAIRLIRARKEELHVTDQIICMGFSAGGMLAGNCATHFDLGIKDSNDPIDKESCRPDGIVLGYGAFTFAANPPGFFIDPFGSKIMNPFFANKEELLYYSPEINIKPDTPPFFIWQTNSDDPRNSFNFGKALTANGVPFEMHLFPQGVHGMALADGNNDLGLAYPQVQQWATLCVGWLNNLGL